MKKILFFALLLMAGKGAYAQTGRLSIDNSLNPCSVHVTVYAMCPSIGATNCGDMTGNIFSVGAHSISTFSNPIIFQAAVGWSASYTLSGSAPSDFQWTQATFDYFNCPCLSPTFGGIIEDVAISCDPGYTSSTTCTSGLCSCTVLGGYVSSSYGTWAPATGTLLSNVTVTFQ